MRIAMLCPYALSRHGGVKGQVMGLSRTLQSLGHQVTVLGPDDGPGSSGGVAGVAGAAGAGGGEAPEVFVIGGVTGLPSNGSVAPLALSPLAAWRAERKVHTGRFDVLHAHEPLAPVAYFGCALGRPVPAVGTFHRSGAGWWFPAVKPIARAVVGSSLQVQVAVSEAARETAARLIGGEFEVLFNGVDLARFSRAVPVRAELPSVLFVGRHEQRKGLGALLDAFAQLERPAVLWVVGDGPETEVQHRRHPPSERVQWLGKLDDTEVADRLAGADVLCAPSLGGESFGVVLLEGMASRCAVVASDIPGYRAAGGGHATLVPPGDVTALSRALGVALADAAAGHGLSSPDALDAAQAHARGWSMSTLAERYVELYERAIRHHKG